ncbi:MAG: cupin domain-containing protein [Bacillota bacterium]|nr:cupin domain-containing protein [Bacillota bacterium]
MSKHSLKDYQEFSAERFTKRIIFNEGGSTAFMLNFEPGQKLPEHKHSGSEVYLLVLSGSGTAIIGGEEIEMNAQDVVHSGGDTELAIVNSGSEQMSVYVVLSKTPNEEYAKNI